MRIEPSAIEMEQPSSGLPLSLQALLTGTVKYRGGRGASREAAVKDLNVAARARSLCDA